MSDETTPAPADELEVEAAAISDGAYTLFVADFNDTETAWEAYEAAQGGRGRPDASRSRASWSSSARPTARSRSRRRPTTARERGLGWGVVGGVVLGVLFPPSIIGSAAVLGAGGAAVGQGRAQRHHQQELEEELAGRDRSPGHSGILALVSDPGVVEIRKALAKANAIVEKAVDNVVADDIKAAAAEADSEAAPVTEGDAKA